MPTYLVSPHTGAEEWAKRRRLQVLMHDSLDDALLARIGKGDTVIGSFSSAQAADVTASGAAYVHLDLTIPAALRGSALSAEELEACNPRLIRMKVERNGVYGVEEAQTAPARRRWHGLLQCLRALKPHKITVYAGLAVLAAIVFSSMAGSYFTKLAECATDFSWTCSVDATFYNIAVLLAACFLYFVVFLVLSEIISALVWSKMTKVEAEEAKADGVVMGLSFWNDKKDSEALRQSVDALIAIFADRPHLFVLETGDYEALDDSKLGEDNKARLAKLGKAQPWQQNARMIAFHQSRLISVRLLPSIESSDQIGEFLRLMNRLFPKVDCAQVTSVTGEKLNGGEAYDSYSMTRAGLEAGVRNIKEDVGPQALRRHGGKPAICIDVTPATKTFSIAGAIVTLNRDLKIGYTSTTGSVRVFDARIGTGDSLLRSLGA